MSLVLWGRRKGDVQFGSLQDWRTHIPVGATRVQLQSAAFFDVGEVLEVQPGGAVMRVAGIEGDTIGFLP